MAKSDNIQWRYREISVDPIIVNSFSNEDKMHFSQLKQSDELADLMHELSEKIRLLIDTQLTARQKQIVNKSYFEQMTQTDIAKELGLCQPTVHKVIHGNIDYQNQGKRYGGAIKKLRKLCNNNVEIQQIVEKITILRNDLQM